MKKSFSAFVREKLKNNEEVLCPKCNSGHIKAKGDVKTSKFFYCSNPDCNGKIIIN